LLLTSVRVMNRLLSCFSTIFPGSSGFVKLGHPVPESYLSWELNSGSLNDVDVDSFFLVVPVLVLKGRFRPFLLGHLVLK